MEIISRLNWVDLLSIIIIIRICYVAFQEGFGRQIFPLLGSAVMMIAGLRYYENLGNIISQNIFGLPPEISNLISFVIIIVGVGIVFRLIKAITDKILKVEWHPFIERFCGLGAGIIRAGITVSLIFTILCLMPFSYMQRSVRDRALFGMYFIKIGPYIYEKVGGMLPALKFGGEGASKEEIVMKITSDKAVDADKPKPKKQKAWEEI